MLWLLCIKNVIILQWGQLLFPFCIPLHQEVGFSKNHAPVERKHPFPESLLATYY